MWYAAILLEKKRKQSENPLTHMFLNCPGIFWLDLWLQAWGTGWINRVSPPSGCCPYCEGPMLAHVPQQAVFQRNQPIAASRTPIVPKCPKHPPSLLTHADSQWQRSSVKKVVSRTCTVKNFPMEPTFSRGYGNYSFNFNYLRCHSPWCQHWHSCSQDCHRFRNKGIKN